MTKPKLITRQRGLLSEAWHYVHGFKGTFWLAVLYAFCIFVLLTLVTSPIHFLGIRVGIPYPTYFLMSLIIGYFTLPTGLGILMLALHHSVKKPIKASHVFSYYQLPLMAQLFLLTALLTVVSCALFMIPSWTVRVILVFVEMALLMIGVFSAMLIADQKMILFPALGKATKAVVLHIGKVIALSIAIGILFLIGVFTALIGFIWIAPLITNIFALFYRDCFGVSER